MTPRRRKRARAGEAGFTLVEVLVAFAIASLACVMVLRVAGDLASAGRRIEAAGLRYDEAEAIVLSRAAAGALRPGSEQGRFGDGRIWTLSVVDVGPALGWRDLPPVWQIRVTTDGANGPLLYATVLAGGLGGF